jgi:cytochrome c oxidase subunit IV
MTIQAHGHGRGHGAHATEKPHPTARDYVKVAAALTVLTFIEVAIFFMEPIRQSIAFVPLLLLFSAAKFSLVVMFYMHLRFDGRLLSTLFVGPLLIAAGTIIALLFLFDHFVLS